MKDNGIRILLVEDEYITLETLTAVLTEMNYTISGDAMNAEEAIAILDKKETDLAILDINIKGDKDGVWLAQQIQDKYHIPFIFLTAFGDESTVQRAIKTEPYGYLVKPFNKVDIFTAVEVALKNFTKQQTIGQLEKQTPVKEESESAPLITKDTIFIRDDYMFVKLKVSEILFLKSDKNYLEIHLPEKRHLVRGKLKDFSENLPAEKFLQVHRSYVINIDAIDSFGAGFLNINNVEIPLAQAYKEELRKRITLF